MSVTAQVLGVLMLGIAALVHVGIWLLESALWSRPSTRRLFGVREDRDAEAIRPWAFNQGFYNLFLAIGTGIGLALLGTAPDAGAALAIFGGAAMTLAAVVLLVSSPRLWRAALVQGAPAAIGIGLFVASLIS